MNSRIGEESKAISKLSNQLILIGIHELGGSTDNKTLAEYLNMDVATISIKTNKLEEFKLLKIERGKGKDKRYNRIKLTRYGKMQTGLATLTLLTQPQVRDEIVEKTIIFLEKVGAFKKDDKNE